jgi:alanyl-tRNA synthetase
MTPGNVGRGYVLRRIQRRALRFASLLGMDHPFMSELVTPVVDTFGDIYPELKKNADFARKALRIEEESFLRTRNRGMKLLDEQIEHARDRGDNRLPGDEAFKLWDTYGFPLDLTREICSDEGISVDEQGYAEALREQRERGVASWRGVALDKEAELVADKVPATQFAGYAAVNHPVEARVLAIIIDGELRGEIASGQAGVLVLDRTPFYAEAGGQVGDTGTIVGAAGFEFEVHDTQKTAQSIHLHRGEAGDGSVRVGDTVSAGVDAARRHAIRRNHSTTHLLQAALKKYVGPHCTQAGSWVGPTGMRFDFTHPEAIAPSVLMKIQDEVNRLILEELPVTTEVLPLEEARQRGAIAPFGEKYGATVRVVSMGRPGFVPSLEFCGGTHLDNTCQAGRFRITGEGSIASGVRRIEGVTGEAATALELEDQYAVLGPLQASFAAKGSALVDRVRALSERVRQLEKELARERQRAALSNLDAHAAAAREVGGFKLATAVVDGLAPNELRNLATSLQDKLGAGGIAVAFSRAEEDKVSIVAAVGADARGKYPAGKVVNALAGPLGGKGGGKPDVAQAGAKGASNLDAVVADAAALVAAIG